MTRSLDLTKPVQTRVGSPARIICADRLDGFGRTIVALIRDGNDEAIQTYSADGRLSLRYELPNDLVNVPETEGTP